MRPFRFSLESVLAYRREIEQEWEIKLGVAVGECNRLEGLISSIDSEERQALKERPTGGAPEIHGWGIYLLRLRQQKEKAHRELAGARVTMEKIRKDYLEASRNRKSLDKLKEKKRRKYRTYRLREESKQMDHLNATKVRGEEA